jgi:hypothetical protein
MGSPPSVTDGGYYMADLLNSEKVNTAVVQLNLITPLGCIIVHEKGWSATPCMTTI